MRKWILASFLLVALSVVLAGCGCEHQWLEASCVTPKTCELCKEVEGTPNGHVWIDATCTSAKACAVCGAVEGTALGHTVTKQATCTDSAKCDTCGMITEFKLEHEWVNATRTSPSYCKRCKETVGDPLSIHDVYPEGVLRHDGEMFKMNVDDFKELFNELKNSGSLLEMEYFWTDLTLSEQNGLEMRKNSYSLAGTDGQKIRFTVDEDSGQICFITLELEDVESFEEDDVMEYAENILLAYMVANGCVDIETFSESIKDVSIQGSSQISSGCFDGVAYRLEVRYHYMTMEIWVQGE